MIRSGRQSSPQNITDDFYSFYAKAQIQQLYVSIHVKSLNKTNQNIHQEILLII
jgi:hypothetical protein